MPEPVSLENYTPEQRDNLARLAVTLSQTPEVSRDFKKLVKKVNPAAQFPDIEVDERFEALKKEQDEREAKRADEERVRRSNDAYEQTRGRVTSKGHKIEDVEKVMKEKGIANYDTAMEYMENAARLAAPTPESLGRMEMPAETNEILKNPKGWAQKTAHAAVSELMKRRA